MTDFTLLATFVNCTRRRIDAAIAGYLCPAPDCPAVVSDGIRYSLSAGGKRFRPVITLAVADAIARSAGGSSEEAQALALPAACAIEMIHTYSLIHDDLPAMDNDCLRRGRPTLHVMHGDGLAVLAGDGLHAEAFGLLAREPAGTDPTLLNRKLRVIRIIAEAAGPTGMVGGQALDLQAAGRIPGFTRTLDTEGLRLMHAGKTGALIRAASVTGAIMAGGCDVAVAAVDAYATDVGLAFQIVDDILDVEGSTGELGKTCGKDAACDKPTYPALFGLDRSRHLAAECIDRALATIAQDGLSEGWLAPMAQWVLLRKH
jgi:geranylgeranyl diphosphate synthase type II